MFHCKKRSLKETLMKKRIINEASNQDFLLFVIKYLSEDKENCQNEWVYDGRYKKRSKCVCGKEGIETVFVVRNEVTNKVLSPIGSVCIGHFSNNIIKEITEKLNPNLFDLLSRNSVNEERLLAMSNKFFSKKDLDKIRKSGVINDSEKLICLKALNKRSATLEDFRKANDILIDKIIPALRKSINAAESSSTAQTDDVYFDDDVREYFETIYSYSKENHLDSDDIEDFFGSLLDIDDDLLTENINTRKQKLYNEFKIINSVHQNFYEARIGEKQNKKYLVLENHLTKDKYGYNTYSAIPSEVNVFELKPNINYVDEIVIDEDFENDFKNFPQPSFTCKVCSKSCLKKFFDNI